LREPLSFPYLADVVDQDHGLEDPEGGALKRRRDGGREGERWVRGGLKGGREGRREGGRVSLPGAGRRGPCKCPCIECGLRA